MHPISLTSFLDGEVAQGHSQIDLGRATQHLLLDAKQSDVLVVFFLAATPREGRSPPPYFTGQGVGAVCPASILSLDDASLQLDPTLALA